MFELFALRKLFNLLRVYNGKNVGNPKSCQAVLGFGTATANPTLSLIQLTKRIKFLRHYKIIFQVESRN